MYMLEVLDFINTVQSFYNSDLLAAQLLLLIGEKKV